MFSSLARSVNFVSSLFGARNDVFSCGHEASVLGSDLESCSDVSQAQSFSKALRPVLLPRAHPRATRLRARADLGDLSPGHPMSAAAVAALSQLFLSRVSLTRLRRPD